MRNPLKKCWKRWTSHALSMIVAMPAWAAYEVPPATGDGWQQIAAFFREAINFLQGPFAGAFVAASFVLAFVSWVFMPKEGIMGPIIRVVISAIAIFNLGAWMGVFGSGTV